MQLRSEAPRGGVHVLAGADYPGGVAQGGGKALRVHPLAVYLRVLQPRHRVHIVLQPRDVAAHHAYLVRGLLARDASAWDALGEHIRVAFEHREGRAQIVREGGV